MPPNEIDNFGQWSAQQADFLAKANGGKAPTTQAEATAAVDKLNKAECTAVKSLGVQVNPQYGRLSYQVSNSQGLYGVTSPVATLSRAAGAATATTATTSLPAC